MYTGESRYSTASRGLTPHSNKIPVPEVNPAHYLQKLTPLHLALQCKEAVLYLLSPVYISQRQLIKKVIKNNLTKTQKVTNWVKKEMAMFFNR
jgi:hypothetical protein